MNTLASALARFALVPVGSLDDNGQTIVLVGPDEPAFWPLFTESPEYKDGSPDPMDRWSRRVLSHVALEMDAEPLFPFGGPPYEPFFTWAIKSGRFWASPIGFLVHDTAGLFASFGVRCAWSANPLKMYRQDPATAVRSLVPAPAL